MKLIASFFLGITAVLCHATFHSYETSPDISGNKVVFTAEGDLWLGDINNHSARRITTDPGVETNAHFSPDGEKIAFTASYDGGADIYTMDAEGGAPNRITFTGAGPTVLGWTPDGKQIVYRSSVNVPVGFGRHFLYVVNANGGVPVKIGVPEGEFASFRSDGVMAYVPVSNEWANWFRYKAGRKDEVWLLHPDGKFEKAISEAGIATTPVWVGKDIVFVSEKSGSSNLYRKTDHSIEPLTRYSSGAVRYPATDGKRVIFQHGPGLGVVDLQTGSVQELEFDLTTDRIHAREQRVPLNANLTSVAIGPTGKRVVVGSRGQIVSVPVENGDFRLLENKPGTRAILPTWSPDGKRIAFISDRTGEKEIWITDSTTGQLPTQLTHGLKANSQTLIWSPDGRYLATDDEDGSQILVDVVTGTVRIVDRAYLVGSYNNSFSFTFSPDSKYFAYVHDSKDHLPSIRLVETAGGTPVDVTPANVDCSAPAFTEDGKFLIYVAETNVAPAYGSMLGQFFFDNSTEVHLLPLSKSTPSPFLVKSDEEIVDSSAAKTPESTAVDFAGIQDRDILVPMPASRYRAVDGVAGHILAIDAVGSLAGSTTNILVSFDLAEKKLTTLASGVDEFTVSKDRKKLLIRSGRSYSVVNASTGPFSVASSRISFGTYTLSVDPIKEWRQIFEESWRIVRDFFYDPGLHGVDWNDVHNRYAHDLEYVGDRSDLTKLCKDMVSELSAGHNYVSGPSPFPTKAGSFGYLGADFEPVTGQDAVKITKIYRGDAYDIKDRSPLLEPGLGVTEGQYILSIAGQIVKRDRDVQSLLMGTVGQTVAIVVNDKPSLVGARTIRVVPVASEKSLRYHSWVEDQIAYVKSHGGPDIGYTHFEDMGTDGLAGFAKGQYASLGKKAMIYDDRYNGGGFVSSLILQYAAAHAVAWWHPRWGGPWTRESWAVNGPKVALCNEFDFSDGELFVETWKRMEIGPVVGHTTGGGEVGSGNGYDLIDGGKIYVPNYAAYVEGKWLIEGEGAHPDIEVFEDPAEVIAGRNPQLDRAIAILKEAMLHEPQTPPMHPPFPIKAYRPGH